MTLARLCLVAALALAACKKDPPPATPDAPRAPKGLTVGLVTDIGGRGDQSFNDSALRGLQAWAANQKSLEGKYVALTADERKATLPPELEARITSLSIKPLVVQSKAQED
jgi:basic membrane protein A and related proteins